MKECPCIMASLCPEIDLFASSYFKVFKVLKLLKVNMHTEVQVQEKQQPKCEQWLDMH